MSDKLLDKYLGKKSDVQVEVSEEESTEDCGMFGWLRGVRDRAIMLEIRHRDGRITAFGYPWLDLVEYNPSEGITLKFSGKSVKIVGSNLNAEVRPNVRLVEGIIRQRISWIAETSRSLSSQSALDQTVIEEISVN